MLRTDSQSRVTAQFSLSWHSSDAAHAEQLWAHPVSFWRDVLDPGLVQELLGKTIGGRADVTMEILEVQAQHKAREGRCEDWLKRISCDGPGMQARFAGDTSGYFAPENFRRSDEQPDSAFYREPRLVQHLDSTARAAIRSQYARLIPAGAPVHDLMGSWDSHLPAELACSGLTVVGMNAEELRHNQRATATLVQDLNNEPLCGFADNSFDAVLCTAAVKYLTNPLAVVAEMRRMLRVGGVMAFALSNRWFPPKAIRVWTEMHEFERMGWVAELLRTTGGFRDLATWSRRGLPRPADDPHQELWLSDPVYMVWAWKA